MSLARVCVAAVLVGGLWSMPVQAADGVPGGSVLPAGTTVTMLDNGLQLVVVPLDTPGIVAVQTWMRVGSGEETVPGLTGYAHFFEHLMFHGSEALPQEAREDRLLRLGVEENAWTSQDATVYHLVLPAESLTDVLTVEADRFRRLSLDADGVEKEAGAVYGEWRKGQASPDRALWAATWATAFSVHPYHHTTLGVEADIAQMPSGLAAAERFFSVWYRPEHATLVIAGDAEAVSTAAASVERTFGRWSPEPASAWPAADPEPPQTTLRRAQVVWERGPTNPRLSIAWRTPAHAPGSVESAVLSLLPALLTSDVAPLHRRLVDDERRARWLWSEAPDSRHPGLFSLMMELSSDADLTSVEDDVIAAILALSEDASDDAVRRLTLARDRQRRALLLGLDSPAAWARALGHASLYRGDVGDLDRELAALAAVTLPDVQRVVRELLVPESGRTVITLVPPELADPQLPAPPLGPEGAQAGGEP